ncbi:MAG: PQQ-binding-like beta-propeller repeat protein [Thermoguttaceae bacterium]|jgi:outer membrane protein assembly factor BamB
MNRRGLALAAVALVAIAAAYARAQDLLGGIPGGNQFELSDTVQLDRADASVLAQLEHVKACLADRQWDEAVETLRQVMENSEGKLLGVAELRWIGLSDACQMQLAALPPEALALYRSRVDAVARKWCEEGVRRRDHRLLDQVVRQAFASRWGDKALLALGEIALESGDFTAARWNWERILPAVPPPGVTNTWPGYPDTTLDPAMVRARLVLVSILEGASDRARDELAALARLHGEARGRLGGREATYASALGDLIKQSVLWPRPTPGRDWPTFAGCPARNARAAAMIDVEGVAWRIRLPQLTPPAPTIPSPAAVAEDAAAPLASHPVVVGDRVFVNDQHEIAAVRLADGEPAWGDAGATVYREPWEGVQGGLANPPDTLGPARFTMTVYQNRLYARMGSAVTAQPQQASSPVTPGSLVCLDLEAEGKLLWKAAPEEGWAFEGAPVVRAADLFVAMRRNDIRPQAHVACFDAPTGRLRWRRFVSATETPARGMLPQSTCNLLSLAGDTIYYNTNLGAVAALSADDGRVLWVSLYPRQRRGNLARLAPHWQRDLNPCLVHYDTLLVAPADSPRILALDARTGQILWQSGADVEDVVHLLGVAGEELIAAGRKLYWIHLGGPNRGQIAHVWPDGPERPGYGRGVLAGDSVLWPARNKVYVFDQKTAEPTRAIDLAPLGLTGGNLVVAGDRLLVATATELVALGPQAAQRKPPPPAMTRTGLKPPDCVGGVLRPLASPGRSPGALRY